MNKFTVTEVFNSIQGEGKWVGQPSIFVRFFGCTLHCPGFSMPRGQRTTEVEEITKTLDQYKDSELKKLPLTKTGCDSYPSWHKECKRFSKEYTPTELANLIISTIPPFCDPSQYHVVFTGGEPLLYQDLLFILISKLLPLIKHFTFETNGTVGLKPSFIYEINSLFKRHKGDITWSCSPKLSISGHNSQQTLFPERVKTFNEIHPSTLYFKYVIRDEQDLKEVRIFNTKYNEKNIFFSEIYLMPEGGTVCNETSITEKEVAKLCLKNGYRFSPRLHLNLFGNCWGA